MFAHRIGLALECFRESRDHAEQDLPKLHRDARQLERTQIESAFDDLQLYLQSPLQIHHCRIAKVQEHHLHGAARTAQQMGYKVVVVDRSNGIIETERVLRP